MTYEEVKETLHKYLRLNRLVRLKKQQLEWAREDAGALTGIDYSKPRTSGGLPSSVVERAVERIDRVECEYAALCDKMFDVEDCIAAMLPGLTDDEQAIVIERYMKGTSIQQIKKKFYFSSDGSVKNKFTKIYRKLQSGDPK